MTDQEQLLAAIEKSNKAFEDFKTMNESKLAASETRANELKASMEKAFADVAAQKTTIEALEAKLFNRRGNAGGGEDDPTKEIAIKEHRAGFDKFLRKGEVAGLPELQAKALNLGTGVDGGYAVPKVIETEIEAFVVNISPVRQVARVVPVGTPDYHKLVNLRGTSSGWVGETDTRPATNTPTLEDVAPPMGEVYANPQATQQMLDDVFFNAESWLAEEVGTEFARQEGSAFIVGNGIKKPRGFLNYAAALTADDSTRPFGTLQYVKTGVAADWAAPTTSVSPADVLIKTVSTIKAPYRQSAKWMMCKSILFDIAAMKDPTGRYVFNPISAPGVPQTILNYPLVEAEDMPAKAANAFSVAFGDWMRAYLIVDRVGVRSLRDPFTNKPYIGFYTTKRLGGGIVNSEALKLIKFEA